MLEFSDAPYQFFPPTPSKPLIWLGKEVNRLYALPCKEHQVREVDLGGNLDAVREAYRSGDRLLFVINHPSHSDPQVMTEIHRQLGIPFCFMAAYDVFLRSKFNGWCMQKLGHFSIDREGSDRKAMATAIETLKDNRCALDIFPEGNVYLTNDRVAPFLDGTAFIAIKAQQSMDSGHVRIVPVSLKFTNLTDCRDKLVSFVKTSADAAGFPFEPKRPIVESVVELGSHVLASHLERHGYANEVTVDKDGIHGNMTELAANIVEDLESHLDITAKDGNSFTDRIRKIRSTIHQIRTDERKAASYPDIDETANKAILAFRILAYLTPYLTEHPTLDRFAETVERIGEDHFSRPMGRIAPRRVYARIGEIIDVTDHLERAGGKARDAIASMTTEMESQVQSGINAINAKNDAPGAKLIG